MIIVPIINKINQNNNHNNEGCCCVPCMGIRHPLCFLLEEQTIQVHGKAWYAMVCHGDGDGDGDDNDDGFQAGGGVVRLPAEEQ